MIIKFNPRISGSFVHYIMNDERVETEMLELGITKDTGHNLVKSVIIKAFTDYEVDINKNINDAKLLQ